VNSNKYADECEWLRKSANGEKYWATACDREISFGDSFWSSEDIRFCPFCGKPVKCTYPYDWVLPKTPYRP